MENTYSDETWKGVIFDDTISEREKHQVSNYGRVKSLKQYPIKGKIISLSCIGGYERLCVIQKTNKRTARYVHLLVAKAFIPKTEGQKYVIHLDHVKTNNHIRNLRWVTPEELLVHQAKDPANCTPESRVRNAKLSVAKVKLIKRKLQNPKRKTRLKMIAKQFGITDMQLYRIQTGENWGHVTA